MKCRRPTGSRTGLTTMNRPTERFAHILCTTSFILYPLYCILYTILIYYILYTIVGVIIKISLTIAIAITTMIIKITTLATAVSSFWFIQVGVHVYSCSSYSCICKANLSVHRDHKSTDEISAAHISPGDICMLINNYSPKWR